MVPQRGIVRAPCAHCSSWLGRLRSGSHARVMPRRASPRAAAQGNLGNYARCGLHGSSGVI
eukprot:2022849-Lingulodinium_polyedra.AAC.1